MQLSNSDLRRLFSGDEQIRNYKMGYPRFILIGQSSTEWFRPEFDEVPDWNDSFFTGHSYKDYWAMNRRQSEENRLPAYQHCHWFSFHLAGVASTSGVTLSSQCNFHTSSEPTLDQLKLSNKIGHISTAPAMDIVGSGLGANFTDRDVQASSASPLDFPEIHGGKRITNDREVCYVVMDTESLINAEYHETGRAHVIGKHLRSESNRHFVITEAPDAEERHKRTTMFLIRVYRRSRWFLVT